MIYLILEKDLEKYEKKIVEIGRRHNVVHTDFGRAGDFYWMRLECLD